MSHSGRSRRRKEADPLPTHSFGFIEVDDEENDDCYENYPYDYDYEDEVLGGDTVFVHISKLKAAVDPYGESNGYPEPGLRLAFYTEKTSKGAQASKVADGADGSYVDLALPLYDQQRAKRQWEEYQRGLGGYGYY